MDAQLDRADGYHRELVARLRTLFGDDLIGVYAGGSFALGAFDGLSDLDVATVSTKRVGRSSSRCWRRSADGG